MDLRGMGGPGKDRNGKGIQFFTGIERNKAEFNPLYPENAGLNLLPLESNRAPFWS